MSQSKNVGSACLQLRIACTCVIGLFIVSSIFIIPITIELRTMPRDFHQFHERIENNWDTVIRTLEFQRLLSIWTNPNQNVRSLYET
jgi:predicted PurR-regulated permease PerM